MDASSETISSPKDSELEGDIKAPCRRFPTQVKLILSILTCPPRDGGCGLPLEKLVSKQARPGSVDRRLSHSD